MLFTRNHGTSNNSHANNNSSSSSDFFANNSSSNNHHHVQQWCPQCRLPIFGNASRPVRDSCGHLKCRQCLLMEDNGCQQCRQQMFFQQQQHQMECCWQPIIPTIKIEDDGDYSQQQQQQQQQELESLWSGLPGTPDGTTRSSKSSNDPTFPNEAQQELSLLLTAKMGCVRQWLLVSDFDTQCDQELEWLRCQYVSRLHDALVNEGANAEVIARGREVGLRFATAANHLTVRSAAAATEATVVAETKKQQRKRNSINDDSFAHIIKNSSLNPPEYLCSICNRQFKNRLNIRYHIACADKSAGHACKECERIFKSSSHLTYHTRTAHDGEKPYKCHFCEKAFAQSGKLKRHELTHTGERPFKCGICQHTFTTKYNLKEHENIHRSDKPYRCVACDVGFADKNNLRRHKLSHNNNKGDHNMGKPISSVAAPPPSARCIKRPVAEEEDEELTTIQFKDANPAMEFSQPKVSVENGSSAAVHRLLWPPTIIAPPQNAEHFLGQDYSMAGHHQMFIKSDFASPALNCEGGLGKKHNFLENTVEVPKHEEGRMPPETKEYDSNKNADNNGAFNQVKGLLSQIHGKEIYKVIDNLSSHERRSLIHILKSDGATTPQNTNKVFPVQQSDRSDAFSDISTGSKKEFLKRYKRQILGTTGSTASSASSFVLPSAANSISALERRQLEEEEWVGEGDMTNSREFPTPHLTGNQFDHIMSGIHAVVQRQKKGENGFASDATVKRDEVTVIKSTGRGLRKVAVFDEDEKLGEDM